MDRRKFLKLLGVGLLGSVLPVNVFSEVPTTTSSSITTSTSNSNNSSTEQVRYTTSTTIDRSKIPVFDEYKWEERY